MYNIMGGKKLFFLFLEPIACSCCLTEQEEAFLLEEIVLSRGQNELVCLS